MRRFALHGDRRDIISKNARKLTAGRRPRNSFRIPVALQVLDSHALQIPLAVLPIRTRQREFAAGSDALETLCQEREIKRISRCCVEHRIKSGEAREAYSAVFYGRIARPTLLNRMPNPLSQILSLDASAHNLVKDRHTSGLFCKGLTLLSSWSKDRENQPVATSSCVAAARALREVIDRSIVKAPGSKYFDVQTGGTL